MEITFQPARKSLRARQTLGKYKIESRVGRGGFASVYRAMDSLEGIRVALKVPHSTMMTKEMFESFRKECRITARLEHPNILPLKDASIIDGQLVITSPLGEGSLADRLQRRISTERALDYGQQLIEAVAYAHEMGIVHCDIKPENVILFADDRARLGDFGIAKVAQNTLKAAGTGTVGYMAPEQAMGKPSPRSDVFSLGLLLYRMFAGVYPEWPFEWPFPEYRKLRRKVHPEMETVIRICLEVNPKFRYRDAGELLEAYVEARVKTERLLDRRRRR
ncbi:MAG: serine/threonine protein kinase [Bacteroidetes bacterium]|nr:serine/threonine protein kinase [Bacteroidota bacterium]